MRTYLGQFPDDPYYLHPDDERDMEMDALLSKYSYNELCKILESHDKLVAALREIKAINDESTSAFRKRGGTRRGLTLIEIAKVLDNR